jgi:ParB family chromosome partitioning protein
MAEDSRPRARLGRGLAALMGDVGADAPVSENLQKSQRKVPIENVIANPRNPRRIFADTELEELAQSIRERGVIQPIVVRPVPNGGKQFEIIAGERAPRSVRVCTKCRSLCSKSATPKRLNLRSSKTSSALI